MTLEIDDNAMRFIIGQENQINKNPGVFFVNSTVCFKIRKIVQKIILGMQDHKWMHDYFKKAKF